MAAANITWPKKRREFHNHHFDSTIWNDFQFRDDDTMIATYAKAGTTWVQQIIAHIWTHPRLHGCSVSTAARRPTARLYPASRAADGVASWP
jgi:hypothetical protein